MLLSRCHGLGNQRMQERVRRHVLSQLLCLGRHTITGILGTSGQLFDDWSADYRMYSFQRIEPKELFTPVRQALTQMLDPDQPLVAAIDDTRLSKTGNKTYGVKYVRDPLGPPFHVNFIKAQRFLQISMASPAPNGMARMIPIDFVHAPSAQKPPPNSDEQTLAQYRQVQRQMALPKVAAERVNVLRSAMDHEGEHNRPLWVVVDGGFTNRTFLKNLPNQTKASQPFPL